MKRMALILIVSLIFSSVCFSENKKNNNKSIAISGAFALYPMMLKWRNEYNKTYPNIKIDVSAGGAGKGIADALNGMTDIGMVSREISAEEIKKGAFFVGVTKDAVFAIINDNSPVLDLVSKKGLTKKQFLSIWINEASNWDKVFNNKTLNKYSINIYTRSDSCGAAGTWSEYLGGKQEDLKGTGIYGDPGMIQAVQKDINGIGYANLAYLFDFKTKKIVSNIQIIPIDINEDNIIDKTESFYNSKEQILSAIKNNQYPAPPSKILYLVTKGKPGTKASYDFIKWILTYGQKYVSDTGFVSLDKEYIDAQLNKIK